MSDYAEMARRMREDPLLPTGEAAALLDRAAEIEAAAMEHVRALDSDFEYGLETAHCEHTAEVPSVHTGAQLLRLLGGWNGVKRGEATLVTIEADELEKLREAAAAAEGAVVEGVSALDGKPRRFRLQYRLAGDASEGDAIISAFDEDDAARQLREELGADVEVLSITEEGDDAKV